ncbi:hypothetical protein AK830_g4090 [Neonectria ditissima]|uniref:Heterokaryon incompatibility domain-containing protein n=1 Tax=Neonectria ditissima TaxID=78410 RepID=A0A0P7B9P1_9HYPO|nr:hypothetical protein AK830_g4090 [Neonectria ditissima]
MANPRILGANLASRKAEIETIKSWMATCISQHGKSGCNTRRSDTFPERLIRISAGTKEARLVNVGSLGHVPEFVALSYCWGLTENLKTLKATLTQMEERIPFGALPLTVKQAFEVVKALGFHYLWVDALCIVQDDETDWQREARKMGAVYSNAILVIAAMSSRGSEEGLYSKANDASLANDTFHAVMQACRTMPRKQWEDFIQQDLPLLCRGWGFQERLLARRIVHFTPAELVWECKGSNWCQCGAISSSSVRDGKINSMNAAFWLCVDHPSPECIRPMWRECVKTFSRRSLTMLDDRGFAIAGVAELLRGPDCADLYVSGLWKDALPFDLLWRCDQSTTLKRQKSRRPSWSWVSVDCGINWPIAKDPGTLSISAETYFESNLEGVKCTHADAVQPSRQYHPTNIGLIHLTTRIVKIKVNKEATQDHEASPFRTEWNVEEPGGRTLPFYPDIQLSNEDKPGSLDWEAHACDGNGKLYYLEIIASATDSATWQAGLIVREHEIGESNGKTYERIGVAAHMSLACSNDEHSFVPLIPAQEVILV